MAENLREKEAAGEDRSACRDLPTGRLQVVNVMTTDEAGRVTSMRGMRDPTAAELADALRQMTGGTLGGGGLVW